MHDIDHAGPRSLTSLVYQSLRSEIISCRMAPGARLRIAPLQAKYHVGIAAVREALSRLATEGLVVAEDQRGFSVAPVSGEDFLDLARTRLQIEALAIGQAIELGDLNWEAGIIDAFHRLSKVALTLPDHPTDVDEGWAALHRKFHYALVCGCQSPWLLQMHAMLYEQTERYRRLSVVIDPARHVGNEHRAIMDAVLARDSAGALAALETHLGETARLVAINNALRARPPDTPGRPGKEASSQQHGRRYLPSMR